MMKKKKVYVVPELSAIPIEHEKLMVTGSSRTEDFKREELEWEDEELGLSDDESKVYQW